MVEPVVRRVGDCWEISAVGRTWRHAQAWQAAVFYQIAAALAAAAPVAQPNLAMMAQPDPGPSTIHRLPKLARE